VLMVGYVLYVRRHLRGPVASELEDEAATEIQPLHVWRWLRRIGLSLEPWSKAAPVWPTFVQVVLALAVIVGGARLFVSAVNTLGERLGISHLVFALLLAPIATELPEKFNSVIWVRRNKDTLALGNMTGAMVFQSSFPVSVGLLLTPWRLAGAGLVAACIALTAGTVLYTTVRFRGRLGARLLLGQGLLYAAYVAYVLAR
jgi:cation:H+ antiporter